MERVAHISVSSVWIPECLDNLLDRKIQGVALSCLEALVDYILSWIYCPYQTLFQDKLIQFEKQKCDPQKKSGKLAELKEIKEEIIISSSSSIEIVEELEVEEPKTEKFLAAKAKVTESITISQDIIVQVTNNLPHILTEGRSNQLVEMFQNAANIVFRLSNFKEADHLIFKICAAASVREMNTFTQKRFNQKVEDHIICEENNITLLVFPDANIFEVECRIRETTCKIKVIAEQFFKINTDLSSQIAYYVNYTKDLTKTFVELATYIAKSNSSDIKKINCPILDVKKNHQGSRRVLMVDTEETEGAVLGISGTHRDDKLDGSREGLLSFVRTQEQADAVLAEARRHGVMISEERAKYATRDLKLILAGEQRFKSISECKKNSAQE